MCITNPSKISDFRENLLHMLLFWGLILLDSYAYSYKTRGFCFDSDGRVHFSSVFDFCCSCSARSFRMRFFSLSTRGQGQEKPSFSRHHLTSG